MTDAIVSFDDVSKRYRRSLLGPRSLREELAQVAQRFASRNGVASTPSNDSFLALREVTFNVERGETVGFIGPNGSGKSTLLKLLAHIIFPTQGRIKVSGSVASLIEVGAGFHPELTGRENVYLYGSMMGMRRVEVGARFDQIVQFAGLESFIDVPLKRYSSGMYVRLGFSVAAHIRPDVLLLDEVLAVGDAAFQSKCLARVEALRRSGMTVVFVSHDMAAVERLCHRVFFLHHGEIQAVGDPQSVIRKYYDTVVFNPEREASPAPNGDTDVHRGLVAEVLGVTFADAAGRETDSFSTGSALTARLTYRSRRPLEDAVFELLFHSPDGRLQCQFTTTSSGGPIHVLPGEGLVEMSCDELGLAPGVYLVEAAIARRGAVDAYDRWPRAATLHVLPGKPVRGLFYVPHRWRLVLHGPELAASEPL